MIPEKIIDTHMHIEAWENDEYSFIDCFEGHRELSPLASLNICCLSASQKGVVNNIMAGLYKLAHPNTYIHGALDHFILPITEEVEEGTDLVTQYRELMEIGFDGIKLIEGKPTALKPLGGNLNHVALDKAYAEMEKDGTHIVFHINDPQYFWERPNSDGWYYGDGTYPTYDQIQRQAYALFEAHPRLKATLAHFFFCGETPEIVEELFAKYPNLCVDLTPGCEMYHSFEANHAYYKDFFKRNSERILLGTDGTFPWSTKSHVWCMGILYDFIATTKQNMAFDDEILTGLGIDGIEKENILWRNFERRVGKRPKEINKDALIAYYEKYKRYMSKDATEKLSPYLKKYLGV